MDQQLTSQDKEDSRPLALKIAGAGYTLGDISGVMASLARGNSLHSLGGYTLWLTGGITAAIFGNPSQARQVETTARKLQDFLQSRGVTIPEDARTQDSLLKKPNFLNACSDFLSEHPSEFLNTLWAVGAGLLIRGSVKAMGTGKELFPSLPKNLSGTELAAFAARTNSDFWIGTLVGTGAISGILIKEDPAARQQQHTNILDATVAYIKEKPLRLSSMLFATTNLFAVLNAVSDAHNRNKFPGFLGIKPHVFWGSLAASFLLSNMLLFTAKRDQSMPKGFSADSVANLEEAAATIISMQPYDQQQKALHDTSAFLATQKNIKLTAPEIAQHLAARIAEKTRTHLMSPVITTAAHKPQHSFVEKLNEQAAQSETLLTR